MAGDALRQGIRRIEEVVRVTQTDEVMAETEDSRRAAYGVGAQEAVG